MSMIHGITVKLHVRTASGVDAFGAATYEETTVDVENVLVKPTTASDTDDETSLHGKQSLYTLAIPKGDTHQWDDTVVEFFGQKFRTVGFSVVGIEDMIPLEWNRKVEVERYEGTQNTP